MAGKPLNSIRQIRAIHDEIAALFQRVRDAYPHIEIADLTDDEPETPNDHVAVLLGHLFDATEAAHESLLSRFAAEVGEQPRRREEFTAAAFPDLDTSKPLDEVLGSLKREPAPPRFGADDPAEEADDEDEDWDWGEESDDDEETDSWDDEEGDE
jgi:phosphopantothenoylcysteine synthetase/decarboxylase